MKNAREIYRRASDLEDAGKFEEAIELYKEVAFHEPTVGDALDRLLETWKFLQLRFANQLLERYPTSIAAIRFKVIILKQASQYRLAYNLCTWALQEDFSHIGRAEGAIRYLRFKASLGGNIVDEVDADFAFLYDDLHALRGKYKMIEALISVPYPEFEPVFTALAEDTRYPEAVRALFRDKARLLKAFGEVYDVLPDDQL